MHAERIQVLVQQASAGHGDSFITLIQEFAPALRLLLATHLDRPSALANVEAQVWAHVRQRLGEWMPETPFAEWLVQIAVDPVDAYLSEADRRAISLQDTLGHLVIDHSRAALANGCEMGVCNLPTHLAALPEGARTLLTRRYRERLGNGALAASQMISESELASSLATARAKCDWRGIAQAPGPDDRLLPPLIEDWLTGTIDVDSRALLASNLERDQEWANQFARQVRVHLALSAALAVFDREHALVLARMTEPGSVDSSRIMIGARPRSPLVLKSTGSDPHKPTRTNASNRHNVPYEIQAKSSPLPWIIAGGMIVIGVIALVAMSLDGNARAVIGAPSDSSSVVTSDPITAPPANPVTPVSDRSTPATGGVLRVDPGRGTKVPLPRVTLSGAVVEGIAYVGSPIDLRAEVSHQHGVTGVEFWNATERLGEVAQPPYTLRYVPPASGTLTITARVHDGHGGSAGSDPAVLNVHQGLGTGTIRREWWNKIDGGLIAESARHPRYPGSPDGAAEEPNFSGPRDVNDNYLQRLRGYVVPPQDGEYVFWICGDDESELWLSSDDTRANLRRIAVAPFGPDKKGLAPEDWEREPSQRSVGITLRRGQRYYIEALHKEAKGNDHIAVGWRLPDGKQERPIPGVHLMPANEPVTASSVVVAALTPPTAPALPTPATKIPLPAPSPTSTRVIRSIDYVASGAPYVVTQAHNGERVYIDREYQLVDLPAALAHGQLIRTRNDDDGASANPHLRFTVESPVDVHLAYATSATSTPAWMQGWAPTPIVVGADKGGSFRLFRRSYPAGQIELGANERGVTAATSNYFVIVVPLVPGTSGWQVVRAINLGGDAVEIDGIKFTSQRQAEQDGASPTGGVQPGPWLSDLMWTKATTTYGKIERDRTMSGPPISIGGKVHAKGLGAHAASEVTYALDGRYVGFTASVGLNDLTKGKDALVAFQVWLDGKKEFDTGPLSPGASRDIVVPLNGRKELRLVVDPCGKTDWDHSDWGSARLHVPGGSDGVLQVQHGRRAMNGFVPKPAVDLGLRSLLGSGLAGNKEGLSLWLRAPDGPARVWFWIGEHAGNQAREFDLIVGQVIMPGVGKLPQGGWERIGPIETVVVGGELKVSTAVLKGTPHLMGVLVEQPVAPVP